jgi:hypothetical protein
VPSTLQGAERRARGRGECIRRGGAEARGDRDATGRADRAEQAAGVRAERAVGGLARGRATRSTEARVAYNTRLQQTLPRLRAAAAEP